MTADDPPTSLALWQVLVVVLTSFIVFVAMDLVWIALVAGPAFKEVLGILMRPTPDIPSGLLAWVVIVGGVYYFAGAPARTIQHAAKQGALLGLVIYGTYELTNLSLINTWTWGLAAADIAWGSFACSCAAVLQQSLGAWWAAR